MNTDRFKFRCWDETHKEYVPKCDLLLDARTGKISRASIFNYNYIVEQCTGLKDKNGKLIFEGDVLSFGPESIPYLVYVQWDINQCRFILRRFDIDWWQISINRDTASKMTIRYNIHDDQFREVTKMVDGKDGE